MSTKPKARVMWANYYPEIVCCSTSRKSSRVRADTRFPNQVVRVAVIPLDDVPALVERAAKAIYVNSRRWEGVEKCNLTWQTTFQTVRDAYLMDARAALTAAGIPCTKRRARK